ncbi:hypothetical protein AAAC51_29590 [Priestia megaterium]
MLPDGEVVVLHEVKLSISGFYRVKLIELSGHHKHDEVESSVIPWKIHQTFYLCAPEGTEPVVHLESFEGTDGSLRLSDCHLQQLSFDLVLCLSVQIEKDVKVEVEEASATLALKSFPQAAAHLLNIHLNVMLFFLESHITMILMETT